MRDEFAAGLLERMRQRLADYHPRPRGVDAAVLVPVTRGPEPQLILTRRASHMSSHAGEVAFPGGKCDPEDRSVLDTALREAWEEVALPADRVEQIGQLDVFTSRVGLRVQPMIGLIDPEGLELVPNPDEIESIFEVPLRFFLETEQSHSHRIRFLGQDVTVPSYNYGDYVIWGLTAFMIVDLMNRVYDADLPMPWPGLLSRPGFSRS